MEIRKANEKDIPQIEELLYQVHKIHSDSRPDLFIPGEKKYTADEVASLISDKEKPIFVYDADEEILGYAFCIIKQNGGKSTRNIKTLYIDDLCVRENARGRHIGTALLDFLTEYAKKIGCYSITLNVWACNKSAMAFYEHYGLAVQKLGMEKIL